MLFLVKHSCAFFKEEAVNAVVACLLLTVIMHAASCYYNNVSALSDVEIVINKVVNVTVGNAGGNEYRFANSKGLYTDIYTRLVFF